MSIMKKIISLILIILISSLVFSLSPNEAVDYVGKTNNFLLNSERGAIISPQVQISYDGDDYWVVAGITSQENVGVYIPINNNLEIADGAIEIRELIATEIVLDNSSELKNSYPASDWPFSHPVKTKFYDFENSLNNLSPSIANVINDLDSISGAEDLEASAREVKDRIDDLSNKSNELASLIEEVIVFESNFFSEPDTNERGDYEDYFEDYFTSVDEYKESYNELKSENDLLRQGIGSFQGEMQNSQKEFYLSVLKLPNETTLLSSFFSLTETTKTFVEQIFNRSKNIENFVLNLETRKNRNNAYKAIYGFDEKINNENSNFSSLQTAANAILDEENVDFWADQDAVDSLRINYNQAIEKYENGIYDKAISFASSAKKDAIVVLDKEFIEGEDASNDLILYAIIALIIILIAVFLAEKFYFKKKKEEVNEMYEDEYYEN